VVGQNVPPALVPALQKVFVFVKLVVADQFLLAARREINEDKAKGWQPMTYEAVPTANRYRQGRSDSWDD